ncbi:MAG: DUF4013 domain-containing protein [Firmicutes bacterium]|nr:DUF4013 domain-containing protein [Bacillota bacterium]
MLCPSCYAEIPDFSVHCSECGVRVDSAQASAPSGQPPQHQAPPVWSPPPQQSYSPAGYYAMPGSSGVLNITDSMSRPFKEPQAWKKLLTIAAWGMIPFVGMIIVLGFLIEYTKRIINNREYMWELPPVDDGLSYLSKGFMYFLSSFIYTGVMFGVTGLSAVPFIGSIAALGPQLDKPDVDPNILMTIFSALAVPILVFVVIVSVFTLFAPLLPMFYARKEQFGDLFKIGEMFKLIFADFGAYVVVHLCLFCAGSACTLVLLPIAIIPILGNLVMLFLSPLMMAVVGAVSISAFGEYYYKNRDKINAA